MDCPNAAFFPSLRSACQGLVLALALTLCLPFPTARGTIAISLDFAYLLNNGGLPVTEIFDDGKQTYLGLAKDADPRMVEAMMRSIIASDGGEVQPVTIILSPPYLTLIGVYDRITIRVGPRQAIARYVGPRDKDAAGPAASRPPEPPLQSAPAILVVKDPAARLPEKRSDPAAARPTAPVAVPPPSPAVRRDATPKPVVAVAPAPTTAEKATPPAPPPPPAAIGVPAPRQEAASGERRQPAVVPVAMAPLPAPAPTAAPVPSAGQPALERKEAVGANRQVARVDTAFVPVQAGVAGKAAQAQGSADGAAPDLYEYTVKVPFLLGKTVLGKEGDKALRELAQIGPIAHEIHILAPREPDSSVQLAHRRASELYRLLVNAGLDRQKFTIEVMDAVPFDADIVGEVVLVVDLNQRAAK
ncbi:MAG TPA: hypothetical protein VJ576_17400 [Rhodocyclaceae bacterium]|nr:hypothetical protein [Rhodocyclaceae bacterium]